MSKKLLVAYWDQGDLGPCLFDKETDEEIGGISDAISPETGHSCGLNAMFFGTREARKQGYKSVALLVTYVSDAREAVNKLAEEAGYTISKN